MRRKFAGYFITRDESGVFMFERDVEQMLGVKPVSYMNKGG